MGDAGEPGDGGAARALFDRRDRLRRGARVRARSRRGVASSDVVRRARRDGPRDVARHPRPPRRADRPRDRQRRQHPVGREVRHRRRLGHARRLRRPRAGDRRRARSRRRRRHPARAIGAPLRAARLRPAPRRRRARERVQLPGLGSGREGGRRAPRGDARREQAGHEHRARRAPHREDLRRREAPPRRGALVRLRERGRSARPPRRAGRARLHRLERHGGDPARRQRGPRPTRSA